MARQRCDNHGCNRPALMFRRVTKYHGKKKSKQIRITSDPEHTLCRQCHNAECERMNQEQMATRRSERAEFTEIEI